MSILGLVFVTGRAGQASAAVLPPGNPVNIQPSPALQADCYGSVPTAACNAAALAAITVFAVVLLLTRYVSLASILGAESFPMFAWMLVKGDRPPFFITVQFVVALLIIAKHHQNIRRLLSGTESRFGSSSKQKRGQA